MLYKYPKSRFYYFFEPCLGYFSAESKEEFSVYIIKAKSMLEAKEKFLALDFVDVVHFYFKSNYSKTLQTLKEAVLNSSYVL